MTLKMGWLHCLASRLVKLAHFPMFLTHLSQLDEHWLFHLKRAKKVWLCLGLFCKDMTNSLGGQQIISFFTVIFYRGKIVPNYAVVFIDLPQHAILLTYISALDGCICIITYQWRYMKINITKILDTYAWSTTFLVLGIICMILD